MPTDRRVAVPVGVANFPKDLLAFPPRAMVERGYPMVWSNGGASFSDLRTEGGLLLQRAVVEDAQGRLWTIDYEMIEVEGAWRINGVLLLPDAGLSA